MVLMAISHYFNEICAYGTYILDNAVNVEIQCI